MAEAENLIQSIEIENFKSFEELTIVNLSHFNLFIGTNNIGKTSVLEALAFATGSYPKTLFDSFAWEHRQEFPQKVEDYQKYFYQYNTSKEISIKIINNNYNGIYFRTEYKSTDPVSISFVQTIKNQDDLFSNSIAVKNQKLPNGSQQKYVHMDLSKNEETIKEQIKENFPTKFQLQKDTHNLILEDKNPITIWYIAHRALSDREKTLLDDLRVQKKLIEFAKRIDPRIETVRPDGKQLKIYYKGINLPFALNEMGTGFIKIIKLYLATLLDDIDVILCDEITDGLHPDTIQVLLDEIIPRLVNQNIQLFATSHSYDILQKIAEYQKEERKNISVYRMFQMPEEKIEARQLSPEQIAKFFSIAELR